MPRPAVSPPDQALADHLGDALQHYIDTVRDLPGLTSDTVRNTLIAQLIDSDRRRRYANRVRDSDPSPKVLHRPPSSFHPLFAAVRSARDGDFDEACWLVLLATHFGYTRKHQWALLGNFYCQLGGSQRWTWKNVVADTSAMRTWLDTHQTQLRRVGGPFGNHRKYESLSGSKPSGTGEALESYARWGGASHRNHFDRLAVSDSPKESFAAAYASMNTVTRFGRIGRFDYLTMLGKLGIVDLLPDKLHLQGATGPLNGARLLCYGSLGVAVSAADLEVSLQQLGDRLGMSYDVMEDALCNWQKSPRRFTSFRG